MARASSAGQSRGITITVSIWLFPATSLPVRARARVCSASVSFVRSIPVHLPPELLRFVCPLLDPLVVASVVIRDGKAGVLPKHLNHTSIICSLSWQIIAGEIYVLGYLQELRHRRQKSVPGANKYAVPGQVQGKEMHVAFEQQLGEEI